MTPAALALGGTPPAQLPGEPTRRRRRAVELALALLLRLPLLALVAGATAWAWPLYGLARLRRPRPPVVAPAGELGRFLKLIWTVRPPAPGLDPLRRTWLSLSLLQLGLFAPLRGLAWYLDDLLYGAALAARPVHAPVFVMSAARSGSTQLARYLEDDPRLVAPNVLQQMFPYLWLWRLVPLTLGRVLSPERVRRLFEQAFPPEFLERHEGDPFRTDTLDAALLTPHPQHLALLLGPEALAEELSMGVASPANRRLWAEDFVALVDRLGRMTLLHRGASPQQRLFLKGHFLAAAEALAGRYPDAVFVTVVREAGSRIQSAINYLAANPADPVAGPAPWAWIGPGVAASEARYCVAEQAWYGRREGPARHAIAFPRFVRDLPGSMAGLMEAVFGEPGLAGPLPGAHPARRRSRYLLDRSLAEAGVDAAALAEATRAYDAWVRALDGR